MSSLLVYTDNASSIVDPVSLLGGKAASLLRLRQIDQPVPNFYVITAQAFRLTLESTGLANRITKTLQNVRVPNMDTIHDAAAQIHGWF